MAFEEYTNRGDKRGSAFGRSLPGVAGHNALLVKRHFRTIQEVSGQVQDFSTLVRVFYARHMPCGENDGANGLACSGQVWGGRKEIG